MSRKNEPPKNNAKEQTATTVRFFIICAGNGFLTQPDLRNHEADGDQSEAYEEADDARVVPGILVAAPL
jgi:hypothetical protein